MADASPQPVQREPALDALRGLAVLGMVLSGSIGFGGALPGWMYHAQLPPPAHRLVATLPGISWVDLVFPMFLFALGAAIPLALAGRSRAGIVRTALRRGGLLLGLALFTQQFRLGPNPTTDGHAALALLAFALLGLMLLPRLPLALRAAAAGVALALWAWRGIEPQRQDIILVVLAWMAALGALLWAGTRGREAWRWWVLPVVVALMLAPPDSWPRALTASPADWAWRFAYLKYLLIVVPGLAVGDALARGEAPLRDRGLAWIALVLVLANLVLLYGRHTGLNAALSAALLLWGGLRARRAGGFAAWAWPLAAALLLLGLAMEPLQGGIRKDPSTFSYQVVTAGLSLLLLLALQGLAGRWQALPIALGRNPVLAYVAGGLCLLPLLQLSGLLPAWSALNGSAPLALLKGLLFTAGVAALTVAANRAGWIWKT